MKTTQIETTQVKLTNNGETPDFTVVAVELLVDSVTPDCLKELKNTDLLSLVDTTKGVVIDNARPTWLAGFLAHEFHATAWVAVNDPRLGAVVIESHSPSRQVSQVLDWKSELYIC
jgi:CRISPR-associated protein Csx3